MTFKVRSETLIADAEALAFADELEAVIGEIANGKRKPQNIPMEPMIALISFARTTAVKQEKQEQGVSTTHQAALECLKFGFVYVKDLSGSELRVFKALAKKHKAIEVFQAYGQSYFKLPVN